MAVWQYLLFLVPKTNFEESYAEFIKQETTDYRKETFYFWKNFNVDILKIATQIDGIIPRAEWSSQKCISWKGGGKLYDNDCDLWVKNGFINDFVIRIDLRNNQNVSRVLETVIKICDENKLMLMNIRYEAFEADRKNILDDIGKSNAHSFLKNPITFLENLK